VRTNWLAGTHLAWAFRSGWARLSDGQRAVWIGTAPGAVDAGKLTRHPGSRGPLTLEHVATLAHGAGTRWWVFHCDPSLSWESPELAIDEEALRFRGPNETTDAWSVP
jgi:hypothetical protein